MITSNIKARALNLLLSFPRDNIDMLEASAESAGEEEENGGEEKEEESEEGSE